MGPAERRRRQLLRAAVKYPRILSATILDGGAWLSVMMAMRSGGVREIRVPASEFFFWMDAKEYDNG